MLMFTNATYIIDGLVFNAVVGSVVTTFSVMFLQCHLMSWVQTLQSVVLLQAMDLMAEGKHGAAVSRPLVLYISRDGS